MAQELQKRQQQDGALETWKHLYLAAWDQAFNEFMFLMAEQYSMELLIEQGDLRVPSPTVKFWRESMKALSPHQMREGLRNYMKSERGRFKPTPGEIEENAPDASDAPRRRTNPDCQKCSGSGWERVGGIIDHRVRRCDCSVVEYGGKVYAPERQLPAAGEMEPAEAIKNLQRGFEKVTAGKVTAGKVMAAAKPMPGAREMSDEELARRRQKMLDDLALKEKAMAAEREITQ